MKPSGVLGAVALPLCRALSLGGRPYQFIHEADGRSGALQDFVTWDEHSLLIRGERAVMFSGEFHPFRLPVPSLYLDVFEKIKALGFNMVSFYVDWALLEGKKGEFRADGIFALEPFFEAATEAGIYLLARPGPYINAEVSGGGFPGYLQQVKGTLRSQAPDYLNSTDNYMAHVCGIIAKYQITNGGPVVLFQPENEYSSGHNIPFPNGQYMQYVIDQARSAGISVPMVNNDVGPAGNYAPGKGVGSVDIYGHDSYPLGFDCGNPTVWPPDGLPTTFHRLHEKQSPKTPYSVIEFQGGAFDPWGGWGFEKCAALVNHEFARVFYKNNLAAGVTIFNIYMIYGGTNWGNLGHPGGYTSYDYGACIRENRVIDREKYSEVKLEAQFIRVSPGYITAAVGPASTTAYSNNPGITVTPLTSNKTGNFFVARQTDYAATGSVSYTLALPTSDGTIIVPQRGGSLSLHGRDSKVHLTDYPVGDYTLLYTTAEVFTWNRYADKKVLVLYGGPDELHEFAVKAPSAAQVMHVEGSSISPHEQALSTVVQWKTSSERQYIQVDNLAIYLVDRNAAYNLWVPVLPGANSSRYGTSLMNPDAAIVNGGYLVRSASVSGSTLSLRADFNASTALEVIGIPDGVTALSVNGKPLKHTTSSTGSWLAQPAITIPTLQLPSLPDLTWYAVDSLPEIHPQYDDSCWRTASQSPSPSPRPGAHHESLDATALADPSRVSLHGSDYGFNTGTLLFRGHFTASGHESSFGAWTSGGTAYASAAWLDDRFLGSFKGSDAVESQNSTYALPRLTAGEAYTVTVIVDTMGLNENLNPGHEDMKVPRGIFSHALLSRPGAPATNMTTWKLTGNLGGQDHADKFRGPLNEGGLFFERQGYHQPWPPLDAFTRGPSPYEGLDRAGVAFYAARMPLDLPAHEYDIPLSFVFANDTRRRRRQGGDYRALLYVNGFQFGKYLSSIGPQTEFPVPEGVLDYNGDNWIGLAVWALDAAGARVPGFTLTSGTPVQSSRNKVRLVAGPSYSRRKGAY
ncbi:beta-galactosidase [Metarhizium album ARSEF 1941]|uniref:Beta-galactosidase n=1 Tax=Metarhizium album (strain ARSEF 1941) TaxID=1081103 RepID=A0A0B2WMP8_METAS|nr:beta-galactosidase [Metarhizium album ARSEF 1941]KHN94270.1 beta-galactosidase [Metarhizium album ARSEF 1941]